MAAEEEVGHGSETLSAKKSSSQGEELGHKSSPLLFSKLISRIQVHSLDPGVLE